MAYILGLSAFYHDSAAALLHDDTIIAACQEERFSRKKHDARFPSRAIAYCLAEAGIKLDDVGQVVFYDRPLLKFERLLETYLHYAPKGFASFAKAMPVWIKEKVFLKSILRTELKAFLTNPKNAKYELLFTDHHQSHAAAAFYPSPFNDSAVLCMDGVGEWATTSAWVGAGNRLTKLWDINFPHSLGLLYSAFTYYCGFKVNSGEYKLMGLAPYGEPKYVQIILDNLIDICTDGSFALNMDYFDFATGLRMTNAKFARLFGAPPRDAESELLPMHMDIARSIQVVTEEIILKLAASLQRESGQKSLCLSGGVALNCVANGRLHRAKIFENIWIQPAAGDAGSALGAAFSVHYEYLDRPRAAIPSDAMRGAFLGPENDEEHIVADLTRYGARFARLTDEDLYQKTVRALRGGAVIGWCQGRMEFGPRALGGRSIIADPRNPEMQSKLNLKIKFRESFRPFAPAVLAEDLSEIFDQDGVSPYMLMVASVKDQFKVPLPDNYETLFGIDKLKVPRSTLPSITHIDYSARIQTVHRETNPRFHELITQFKADTGVPVLVNTSFNVRGEPIVNTTADAYRCFMRTEMDCLVVGNYYLEKGEQPPWHERGDWRTEFSLD